MSIVIGTTWENKNPTTIYNTLARKLGRTPTNAEVKAEVERILSCNGLGDWA